MVVNRERPILQGHNIIKNLVRFRFHEQKNKVVVKSMTCNVLIRFFQSWLKDVLVRVIYDRVWNSKICCLIDFWMRNSKRRKFKYLKTKTPTNTSQLHSPCALDIPSEVCEISFFAKKDFYYILQNYHALVNFLWYIIYSLNYNASLFLCCNNTFINQVETTF